MSQAKLLAVNETASLLQRPAQNPRVECACEHHPKKCSNQPWHACRVIAEAQALGVDRFTGKYLAQAKQFSGVADAEIRGTVAYLLGLDDFWRNRRIPPAKVLEFLPVFRKNANGTGRVTDARDSGAVEDSADFLLGAWRPELKKAFRPKTTRTWQASSGFQS